MNQGSQLNRGYLAMVLHAHLPYVRHEECAQALEERWLFEAYTETYLPLLAVWERLQRQEVPFAFAMTISPTLLSLLDDAEMSARFVRHLKKTIQLTERELVRTMHEPDVQQLARMYYARHVELLGRFERYERNIVGPLVALADSGHLELLTCAATHGFLPLLGNTRSREAQIRVAVETHRRITGRDPRGIWLPECGYVEGIERVLEQEGLRYFLVDSHAFAEADAESDSAGPLSLHAPLRLAGSQVHAFARDPEAARQVWSSFVGYPGDPEYREYYRDIGFDLDWEIIRDFVHPDGIRVNTGIKYHRVTGQGDHKELYRPDRAKAKVLQHAEHFVSSRVAKVQELADAGCETPPLVVAPYDAELFGHWWYEGPQWLEQVALHVAGTPVQMITPQQYLERHRDAPSARMGMTSWGRNGYAEVWLNPENDWIYPHLHRIEERLIGLVRRKRSAGMDELTEQALRQMAREVLLAESSDWAFIMTMGTTVEYAVRRTTVHLMQAQQLAEAIESGAVDAELVRALEAASPIFPDLNLDFFLDADEMELTNRGAQPGKRRVLMLAWEFPPRTIGGLARAVYDLSRALVSEGAEVHVVTCHGDDTPEYERVEGVHVHRVAAPVYEGDDFVRWTAVLNMRLAAMGQRVLQGHGPFDVVHAHDWLVADSALLLAELHGCSLVTTIHATEHGRNYGLHNDLQHRIAGIEQRLCKASQEVIVCSQYMRAELTAVYGVPDEKLNVLPNGVDLAILQRGTQQELGEPVTRTNTVFYVGRLVREKGVQVLLDAAPQVLARCPEARFAIAGKGPMLAQLQEQAERMGLAERVDFLGFVTDEQRNRLIEDAGAAVFPSLYEPFGIVALEAMGLGAPTVVSRTGGLTEIVEHEQDGWLVEPGRADVLADVLIEVLSDSARTAGIARAGQEKTVQQYGWGQIARGTQQVYEEALGRQSEMTLQRQVRRETDLAIY
jgi:1,4-alpha-glucan branching enzyme